CGRSLFATINHTNRHFDPINIAVIYGSATVSQRKAFFTSILKLLLFLQPTPPSRFLVLGDFNYTY
ncbi:hypothetical protein CLU79DRAFT_676890, partial [Phycomyces nitens]